MTQNQVTLSLMGWVPMRGLLHHALWNPADKNVVRPSGGGYLWSGSLQANEEEITWEQWPDEYERMELEVIDGASEYTSRAYGTP